MILTVATSKKPQRKGAGETSPQNVVIARQPNEDEQALKRICRGKLETDRARLLLTHPFTATLALQLEIVPVLDFRLPTASTDGRSLFFQVRFMETLSPAARVFVMAHEVWHNVAGHLIRHLGRDAKLWNLAVDHEVNALLARDGFELPRWAVYFRQWEGESAEAVYSHLQFAAHSVIAKAGDPFDIHCPGQGPGNEPAENTQTIGNKGKGMGHFDAIRDPDYAPRAADEAVRQEWREKFIATAEEMRGRGELPGALQEYISQLLSTKFPWRSLLRQFVQRAYGGSRTWLPPARRHLYRGIYLPGMRAERLRLTVAIDTSGSTRRDLPVFMTELVSLLRQFDRIEMTLIECDCKVQRVRQFESVDSVDALPGGFLGGGGTDLRPPFGLAIQDSPDCFIYLTDGDGPAPQRAPSYPVLWVLTKHGRAPCSWGLVAKLGD